MIHRASWKVKNFTHTRHVSFPLVEVISHACYWSATLWAKKNLLCRVPNCDIVSHSWRELLLMCSLQSFERQKKKSWINNEQKIKHKVCAIEKVDHSSHESGCVKMPCYKRYTNRRSKKDHLKSSYSISLIDEHCT